MSNKSMTPISIITNGDMSLASLTSPSIPIQWEDNVGIQVTWSGSPVGAFAVPISLDQINWVTIPTSAFNGTYPVPGTTTSPGFLDMNQLSASYIRLVYTKVSGTGTLNALLVAKGV
jgi:hypothetical protein